MGGLIDAVIQRKWLVPLFAGAAVVLFGFGYGLHRSAEPPDVASIQRGTQVVDVSYFTSNPDADIQVAVNVDVSITGSPTYSLLIVLDPGPRPYDVLFTSSIPDTTHLFRKMSFDGSNFVGIASPNLYYYVATSPSINLGFGAQKAKFVLPSDSFMDDKGTLVARLPSVGLQDDLGTEYFGSPAIPNTFAGGALPIDPVYLKHGRSVHSVSPADFEGSSGTIGTVYAPPASGKFHSLVTFSDRAYGLDVAQVQGNSPSDGVFKDDSFQWTGGFGLAPYISLVQPTALESRTSDDFLSGIILATAAAALIACCQEIPEAVRNSTWLRRRRDRPPRKVRPGPAQDHADRSDVRAVDVLDDAVDEPG